MKNMNLDAYRFSISWSRVLPSEIFFVIIVIGSFTLPISIFFLIKKTCSYIDGKLSGGINPEGIRYYNNLIDNLLANG